MPAMPLRGRHEDLASLDSNLYKLLLFRTENFPEMKTWIYIKEYTSPEIVNEILALMGNTMPRSIVSDIQSRSWFSIIADEATDNSRIELMSLSLSDGPTTTINYQIHEECLVWFNYTSNL